METLGRIDRRSLADDVADHIRRLIFDGVLLPGARVPTDSIAEALGVSALPVREAIKTLGRDGLLELRPHRGAVVAEVDERFLREHFEIVGMVQALAAVGTMERGDTELLQQLSALAERARRSEDPMEVHATVMTFLGVLAEAGGSPAQRAVLDALGRVLPTGYFAALPGAAESGRRGLGRVARAMRAGDADRVRRTCIDAQRERCDVVVRHLRATGVFA